MKVPNVTINNGTFTLTGGQSDVISQARYGVGIRRVLMITNLEAAGGSNIYVSVGQEAVANKGIQLQPGQSFLWSMDGGYLPPNAQVTAYSAGTPTLAIYEEIELM